MNDTALVIASQVDCEQWIIRVYLVDVEDVVDQALKKSMATGTTRTATKRASQRLSLSRKRRKFADLSEIDTGEEDDPVLPVPLHRIDPHIAKSVHRPRDVIEWMMVRNTQQELLNSVCVCGLKDITDASVRLSDRSEIDPDTGEVHTVEEYVVDVSGSNLVEVATLPPVDMKRIVSNDVMGVFETLGITAASQVLFQELRACLGASGSRVDDRLCKLVCDVMCHNGFVMPISRHGLNRLKEHGILAKVTFEETLEQLFEAASTGMYDPLLGVSENVMVGRQAKLGTNLSRMMMDTDTGERVECTGAASASTGPDTRILTSVVTEAGSEDFEEPDQSVPDPDRVDRLLMTKNVHSGNGRFGRAIDGNAREYRAVPTALFHRPALSGLGGTQEVGAPPVPEHELQVRPFRPSSPSFAVENSSASRNVTEPFRPTSPDLDE